MAERMSERLMWWTVITAGAVGALVFGLLIITTVWGVFGGAVMR